MIEFTGNGRCVLHSPTAMPQASGFLWNPQMLIQMNCRGYAVAQFMQPEPAKYTSGPMLEAKTFMQPEQPYYAHNPGRFFYVKDEHSGTVFSAPYEPVRAPVEQYRFFHEAHRIGWKIQADGLELELELTLANDRAAELWTITLTNPADSPRSLSLYPYFPVGYRSWMNQSGYFDPEHQAMICKAVTPYQKVQDYFANRHLKDWTCLLAETSPQAWEARQQHFEGEGGLHGPGGLQQQQLDKGEALYELPAAILQYRLKLAAGQSQRFRFVFAPVRDDQELAGLRKHFFGGQEDGFRRSADAYRVAMQQQQGCIRLNGPQPDFDQFVNHWLGRQLYYHGDVNRLTTDPQTRNYLQDNMGMAYLQPLRCREALITALSQQKRSGEMPDGILLHPEAELKYINQVPHADHCVWLPICLQAYLDETDDYALLDQKLSFADSEEPMSVANHLQLAMEWLLKARDHRGLSLIHQGDWCDPMNMVGYQGKGVSAWLTLASAYAFRLWADICLASDRAEQARHWQNQATELNKAANQWFWADNWYARGITDQGRLFGTAQDREGQIYLNPQSWAMLSGAADSSRLQSVQAAIEEKLMTPFGPMMLAPAYTAMVEDVGRLTQKFPGTAENGSVYNHAVMFYIHALYQQGLAEQAFELLKKMLPSETDWQQRGQFPVFIPNYYRGAWHQYPQRAGRSSQLFNTGTVSWYYRCVTEGLLGLRGCRQGLRVNPQLPAHWSQVRAIRHFRGARINVEIQRQATEKQQLYLDGVHVSGDCICGLQSGTEYQLKVILPGATGHD
ncbi:GH36-type glycosyl hydrolase domain-containing protein [Lacimicrobium alkaliphilum]|uniref:NdvB protein n=1 Tax=Lacimicrobium alkaliphilum TaxID=1526571 RepID=A0A0U2ZBP9_9ALTE|nr:NdvB protein [Lacimicrobium alkaliphilum]ALS99908.1 NdvB protein [Lacimicrobium alkaliphilum]